MSLAHAWVRVYRPLFMELSKSHFRAEVVVMPKAEVADPQGQAIQAAVSHLTDPQYDGVAFTEMRAGKVFRFTVEAADEAAAQIAVERLADQVLANHNTESFSVHLTALQPAGA